MPRPALLFLTALAPLIALTAWSPPARAEASSASVTLPKRHGHHRRRAKVVEHTGRAPRDGGPGADGKKHGPVERAESIGSPNDGHLKGGVHVDLSRPYYRVVPAYESGDVRWGMPQLVNMIDRAARDVHKRFPGSVLDVGDLSQKGGGDLLRHHSHESGRDADLGFYVVDAKGKQIHARTFIKFDTSMASPTIPGARYDLARNWAFVQDLLSDPVARVSHVFIAEWIRHELLAYARPRTSHAMWERAASVLMQPHHSLPHDDHIHVRISCPHDAHGSCIELAKVAPHGRSRVARKGQPGGHVLRTPSHLPPHAGRPPAAAATAPQDPLVLPELPLPQGSDAEPDFDVFDEKIID